MDIKVWMRQVDSDRWVASSDGDRALRATGATRDECMARLRQAVRELEQDEPASLVVEVLPLVAGVAEAARVLGWDKRRIITYVDRGRFPEPIQALASGRIWLRSDVERFAEEWRARQVERKRRIVAANAQPPAEAAGAQDAPPETR